MLGPILTHWTIRLALVALAVRLCVDLVPIKHVSQRTVRAIWTVGCLAFLAHVWCAFHFYHHYSHAEAFEVTAKRTQEMLGTAFGAGIYFSYLFAMLWSADVVRMWLRPTKPVRFETALLVYLAFIAFNGAVVFEGGVTRWFGVPISIGLAILAVRRFMSRPNMATERET